MSTPCVAQAFQPVGRVECYSGDTFAQAPRALFWLGQRHPVAQVEQRWRTPEGPAFRVQVQGGREFELHYHELCDLWTIKVTLDEEVQT